MPEDPGTKGEVTARTWNAESVFESITSTMDAIGTGWIFVLLIIINIDIFSQVTLNRPVRGVPEIVGMSIVALVFLQAAHTLRIGRLTRSEALIGSLLVSRPKIGHFLQGVFNLVGAALFAILIWYSIPLFTKAWTIGDYVGAHGDFMAPVWPVKLLTLIGCLAAGIEFLLLAYQDFRQVVEVRSAENLAQESDDD